MTVSVIFLALASFLLLQLAFSEELDSPAALLYVYKSTKNLEITEGMPFVVEYKIINKGEAAASEIKLKDKYETKKFIVEGTKHEDGAIVIELDSLAPEAEYNFNVTLTPKAQSLFWVQNLKAFVLEGGNRNLARIQYNPFVDSEEDADEDADAEKDYRRGSSSSLGRLRVLSKAEYIKKTSYYVLEWLVFVVGCYFAIATPYNALKAGPGNFDFDYRNAKQVESFKKKSASK